MIVIKFRILESSVGFFLITLTLHLNVNRLSAGAPQSTEFLAGPFRNSFVSPDEESRVTEPNRWVKKQSLFTKLQDHVSLQYLLRAMLSSSVSLKLSISL